MKLHEIVTTETRELITTAIRTAENSGRRVVILNENVVDINYVLPTVFVLTDGAEYENLDEWIQLVAGDNELNGFSLTDAVNETSFAVQNFDWDSQKLTSTLK